MPTLWPGGESGSARVRPVHRGPLTAGVVCLLLIVTGIGLLLRRVTRPTIPSPAAISPIRRVRSGSSGNPSRGATARDERYAKLAVSCAHSAPADPGAAELAPDRAGFESRFGRALAIQSAPIPIRNPPLNKPYETGWYSGSALPGRDGAAVILGHVDVAATGPAVFYNLARLRPGDSITVGLQQHASVTYQVDGIREYAKSALQ